MIQLRVDGPCGAPLPLLPSQGGKGLRFEVQDLQRVEAARVGRLGCLDPAVPVVGVVGGLARIDRSRQAMAISTSQSASGARIKVTTPCWRAVSRKPGCPFMAARSMARAVMTDALKEASMRTRSPSSDSVDRSSSSSVIASRSVGSVMVHPHGLVRIGAK